MPFPGVCPSQAAVRNYWIQFLCMKGTVQIFLHASPYSPVFALRDRIMKSFHGLLGLGSISFARRKEQSEKVSWGASFRWCSSPDVSSRDCCAQVGRDIESQKSIQVPALVPGTHAELEKQRQGVQRQAHRQASRSDDTGGAAIEAAAAAGIQPESQLPAAGLTSLRRMHWQDRNTQGRVFGGAPP